MRTGTVLLGEDHLSRARGRSFAGSSGQSLAQASQYLSHVGQYPYWHKGALPPCRLGVGATEGCGGVGKGLKDRHL